ncbi:ARM repeat-containing protein, partial [Mycena floridula]
MESTERLVKTWIATGSDQEIDKIVSEISVDQTSLLNIVKALGEYLTSEDDSLRSKGVQLLSSVLHRCPAEKISQKTTHFLVVFYCEKLDDLETIIPALNGLVPLTSLSTCTAEDAQLIIGALFKHVNMKALVQSVRFFVFSIIDNLMARHRQVLKDLGQTFLAGYLNLADGEKDPRNLLVAFAIARVILIEFDISSHVESMFNITFCYFPITFRPPPNDPYGITSDDLRLALRSCLNATPAFGLLGIPVLMEKLIAGSPTTKKDALETISSCLPVYGSAVARSSARKLWNVLKLEIFQPTDRDTEEKSLKAVQVLVDTIYLHGQDPVNDDQAFEGLVQDVCVECIGILREPEKSQAKPAVKVLCAFMATAPSVAVFTVSQVVPHLVKLFLNPDDAGTRPSILLLLSDIIAASRESMSEGNSEDAVVANPLKPFQDEVLGVAISGLKASGTRGPALACLLGLVSCKALLSEEELGFVVHNVNEILLADPDDADDASDAVIKLLSCISLASPRHVKEQTLPLLFGSLPDQAPSREDVSDRIKYRHTLSTLKMLCQPPELFEILVIRLTAKLDLLCVPSMADPDPEPSAAFAHALLLTLSQTIAAKIEDSHVDIAKYVERLVPNLFNLFIYSALVDGRPMIATEPRLLEVAGQIISLVVQAVSTQRQQVFAITLFSAFLEGQVQTFAEGFQKLPTDVPFLPFSESSPVSHKNLFPLFSSAVVALRREISLPVPDLLVFLKSVLVHSISQTGNELQRQACRELIASIVNKRPEDAQIFLDEMLNNFWKDEVANIALAPARRQHSIKAWESVSKALLVRHHALARQFTDRLFEVFADEAISWAAAKAVGGVIAPDPVLIKRNHAVVKILYAQRFVNAILPQIISSCQDPDKQREHAAYLVALASLIKTAPKATYVQSMPALIPLLLRGLELPDDAIRANVIDTFLAAAEGDSPDKSMVSQHASSLVSMMLKNSLVHEMPSIRVRVSAVRYLGMLPSIVRYDVLHPSKAGVLRDLAKILDDPKRAVRKEAVDARQVF